MAAFRLLLITVLIAVAIAPAPIVANPAAAAGDLLVYDESRDELRSLDAETLAPGSGAAIPFGSDVGSWSFARSADGATLVSIDNADPRAFTIRNGITGETRYRVETEYSIMAPVLNADGSRLLAQRETTGALSWVLYDVVTGETVSTFDCPEGWAQPDAVSPDLSRLYYLTIPSNNPQLQGALADHPELVTVDLRSGEIVGRTLLPDIDSGAVPPEEPVDESSMFEMRVPGMAVSPDGATIVVVRADRAGYTLVDAATLEVERTVAITRSSGAVTRLLRWLSLAPQTARAKMGVTDTVSAAINPAGDRLYIWGTRSEPEIDEQREIAVGTGLIAVELASGEIVAERSDDLLVSRVAFNGAALFVTGPTSGRELRGYVDVADVAELASSQYLQRLDQETLAVQAAVDFPEPLWIAADEEGRGKREKD